MSTTVYIAFGFIFVSMLLARFININAINDLSPDQKEDFLKSFTWIQVFNLIGIMLFVALYFWLSSSNEYHSQRLLIGIYGGLSIIYLLVINIWGRYILRKKDFPKRFINKYILASVIRVLGLAIGLYLIQELT